MVPDHEEERQCRRGENETVEPVEDAVADQQKFAELHAEHWPEATVVSTLRQISEDPGSAES